MKIYILKHTITSEVMAAFISKQLAEKWQIAVNYSQIETAELKLDTDSVEDELTRIIEDKEQDIQALSSIITDLKNGIVPPEKK